MKLRFLTSTPLDVRRGSGTFVGMRVLARTLEALGHSVAWETPRVHLPVYTLERLLFNRLLRTSAEFDLTVGFDLDGYRIAAGGSHVAALKGVIADELRFESGLTRATMKIQAMRERRHVQLAHRVLTTSRYSARRAQELYGLHKTPAVVPELIDLESWQHTLRENPAASERFTVLFVGRFYRRKRIDVLLDAAALLRGRIPNLEIRIVGNGPCAARLRARSRGLRLHDTVTWAGDVSHRDLAQEYNRADVFCLPSEQEGFGIVLLEAMAAAKPIVAARAAAIPETAPYAELVEPGNAAELAAAIESLYASPERRAAQAGAGPRWVQQFDAPRVARLFLETVTRTGATCTST